MSNPQPFSVDDHPAFVAYDFDADAAFQAGVRSILSKATATTPASSQSIDASSSEAEDAGDAAATKLLNAKRFYFRKFVMPTLAKPSAPAEAAPPAPPATSLPPTSTDPSIHTAPLAAVETAIATAPAPSASLDTTAPSAAQHADASAATAEAAASSDPTYPRSFAEICAMVARGEPVPGVRTIPDTTYGMQMATSAQMQPRRKPWEKEEGEGGGGGGGNE
ncbi:hypothetical protein DFJ73DRAFT_934508 [Zopfochytrium polystomum]|nr:hypothetical protein DFJ73DRAFT_934508 [Zopfochytrium polystomum]